MLAPMPEVLSIEDATARHKLGAGMESADLRGAIEDEERWLARLIGPLTGTLVHTIPGGGYASIFLPRTVSAVTEITDGLDPVVIVDPINYYLDGRVIYSPGYYWTGPITVTATLDDEAAVRLALVDLLRLRLGDTGHQSETGNDYSYSDAQTIAQKRADVVAALLSTRGIL
jgi:hypothetical protein